MCRLRLILGCEFADLLAGLGVDPAAEGVAEGSEQRPARRMVRATLAIGDARVQEGLIKLAQTLAAEREAHRAGRPSRRGCPKAGRAGGISATIDHDRT
jgi:hypothetical protein